MDKFTTLLFSCVFFSGFLLSVVYANNCKDCDIEHKQTIFCESDFAFKATVLRVTTDDYNIRRYLVKVNEVFKGQELFYDTAVEIESPVGIHLCSRNLETDTEYLITGHQSKTLKLEFVYCDWVEVWESGVTDFQQEALRNGYYDDTCDNQKCLVRGTKSAQPKNGLSYFSKDDCYFNPVFAHMHKYTDCEMDAGVCVEEEGKCTWTSPGSETYQSCYDLRHQREELKETEEGGAFAITSYKDCVTLYKGKELKKYKKCIFKVRKAKQNLQVLEMGDVLNRMTELEELEEEEKEIDIIIEREEQTHEETEEVETEARNDDDAGAQELLKLFKQNQNLEETQDKKAEDIPHEVELLKELERILKANT